MDISLFLARLLGLYFLISGLFIIVKRDAFKAVFKDYFSHSALVVVNGFLSLLLGLLIVLVHNVWEWSYKVWITLFGYLSVVRGIVHLFFPEWAHKISKTLIKGNGFLITGFVFFLLGLYLTYMGFTGA